MPRRRLPPSQKKTAFRRIKISPEQAENYGRAAKALGITFGKLCRTLLDPFVEQVLAVTSSEASQAHANEVRRIVHAQQMQAAYVARQSDEGVKKPER